MPSSSSGADSHARSTSQFFSAREVYTLFVGTPARAAASCT
jgi:hypothetical protein